MYRQTECYVIINKKKKLKQSTQQKEVTINRVIFNKMAALWILSVCSLAAMPSYQLWCVIPLLLVRGLIFKMVQLHLFPRYGAWCPSISMVWLPREKLVISFHQLRAAPLFSVVRVVGWYNVLLQKGAVWCVSNLYSGTCAPPKVSLCVAWRMRP